MESDKSTPFKKTFNARPAQRLSAVLIDLLIAGSMAYLLPIAGPVLSVIYFLTKDALPFLNGQSLGKRFVGIKVVNDNQEPIINNYSASIIRSVTLAIPILNVLDILSLLMNQRKRWGDKLAHTRVVNE